MKFYVYAKRSRAMAVYEEQMQNSDGLHAEYEALYADGVDKDSIAREAVKRAQLNDYHEEVTEYEARLIHPELFVWGVERSRPDLVRPAFCQIDFVRAFEPHILPHETEKLVEQWREIMALGHG